MGAGGRRRKRLKNPADQRPHHEEDFPMTASYLCKAENIEVFSDAPISWLGPGVYSEHVVYIPIVMEDGRVGYCVHGLIEGQQEFIYFNPSSDTDDGVPNVFIYQGLSNDPGLD